jgi:hypothetical protein
MRFAITIHSGHGAPPDALERLWQRLGPNRDEASFALGDGEIAAEWREDEGDLEARETRAAVAREQVLEILREVSEEAPELELDWFAITPARY